MIREACIRKATESYRRCEVMTLFDQDNFVQRAEFSPSGLAGLRLACRRRWHSSSSCRSRVAQSVAKQLAKHSARTVSTKYREMSLIVAVRAGSRTSKCSAFSRPTRQRHEARLFGEVARACKQSWARGAVGGARHRVGRLRHGSSLSLSLASSDRKRAIAQDFET